MRGLLPITVLAALAAGAVGWRWLATREAPPAPVNGLTVTPALAESAPEPAKAELPAARPADAAPEKKAPGGTVKFPDGSSMPALNGVVGEVVQQWGTTKFTKVIGVEDGPGGWKWYVHENGVRSTTAMVDMNGVPQAMGLVAEQQESLPVLPDGGLPPPDGGLPPGKR
jgi:hypothetical protein